MAGRVAFGAASFVAEVARQGLRLTKMFYRSPEGNAIVERFFRTLKEECVWQHQFESFAEAERVISQWIRFTLFPPLSVFQQR